MALSAINTKMHVSLCTILTWNSESPSGRRPPDRSTQHQSSPIRGRQEECHSGKLTRSGRIL